jgi:hypothetical protein
MEKRRKERKARDGGKDLVEMRLACVAAGQ